MKISFIGYGKIARALISGWQNMQDYEFRAAAPSLENGITPEGIKTTSSNIEVTKDANIIILAVKPMQMDVVLAEIAETIPKNCLVISVATGLKLSWFAKRTPPKTAVIRAMPNIAAEVAQSATPLINNQYVNEQQRATTEKLFNAIGIITWVQQEDDIDIFTALSGSGPAYVFQFIQGMITAAINMGLDEKQATDFTLKTVSGATYLAINSNQSLQALTEQVTSKGGTTAAALRVFQEREFSNIIDEAMKAAQKRAKELNL